METTHSDDRSILRIDFTANQSLQRPDNAGGQNYGVFGGLGIGAVAADSAHLDVDTIDVGEGKTRGISNGSGGKLSRVVKPDDIIGFWKPRVQAVREHRPRTRTDFFGRLQYHHQCARPFVLVDDQLPRGADPARHMRVMAAGMHHAGFNTRFADALYFRRVRQAGLFDHRQPVHVSTDHHHRTSAVFHHRDNTGLSDFFGYGKAKTFGLRR